MSGYELRLESNCGKVSCIGFLIPFTDIRREREREREKEREREGDTESWRERKKLRLFQNYCTTIHCVMYHCISSMKNVFVFKIFCFRYEEGTLKTSK